MKSALKMVLHGSLEYQALMFACPGCAEFGGPGFHRVPVGGNTGDGPRWEWNGSLAVPTLTPSIRCRLGPGGKETCHSYLIDGVLRYLPDSTHSLAGSEVPLPDLPN